MRRLETASSQLDQMKGYYWEVTDKDQAKCILLGNFRVFSGCPIDLLEPELLPSFTPLKYNLKRKG